MVDGEPKRKTPLKDRLTELFIDTGVITQAFFKGKLIINDGCLQRRSRLESQHLRNKELQEQGVCLSEIERGISRFWHQEPIPVFGLDKNVKDWWAIMPVWRARKKAPPLPIEGKSGKLYKHGQKIPLGEID